MKKYVTPGIVLILAGLYFLLGALPGVNLPEGTFFVLVGLGLLIGRLTTGKCGFTISGFIVLCLGAGLFMEPIAKWGPWMDLVSIYIIPIGATLGAVSWFYVMKKDDLLTAINTGSHKTRGALWYSVGRYVYVPLALVLCLVALIGGVAF